MSAAMAMEGRVGLSMICDRKSARCVPSTDWSTEEEMSSSEQPMRQRSPEIC